MTTEPSPTAQVAAEQLRRARDLVPGFRARAAETVEIRRIPDRSIAELSQAQLFKAWVPKRYGGFEMGLDEVSDIIVELARGCGSTAWVYGVLTDHGFTVALYPEQAQDDVWAGTPDALVCSGLAPAGNVARTDGGYRLSGRWSFSSGCDHADWVFVQSILAPVADGDKPDPQYFLVPRADYEVIDNWFVVGLAGTGSKEIDIKDAFVPAHRALRVSDANNGTSPGAEVNGSVLYRMPRVSTIPFCLVSPAVGTLQALLDAYIEQMRAKNSRGFQLAEQATIQMRVAEASAELDSARLLLNRACAETMAAMRAEGMLTMAQRARNRRDMGYVTMLCIRAADRVFGTTGAAGLFDGNEMGRMYHDIRAVGAHYINSWDISGTTYGRVTLGLEPNHPAI